MYLSSDAKPFGRRFISGISLLLCVVCFWQKEAAATTFFGVISILNYLFYLDDRIGGRL